MRALEFLDNQADVNEGLGDAGIETFKDTPYASAAKEAGQNSRDAGLGKPIKLAFRLHEIERADLPCVDQLAAALESCMDRVKKHYDEKEEDFFLKASDLLKQPSIKVLEIADYNTKGLKGPAEQGTPFYALLKGTGVTIKGSDTSAGSFGIGKNASFAISDLQTVFYSTVYLDDVTGVERFLAQGKTKLVSHMGRDGKPKMATGWWGLKDFKEVDDPSMVPSWMRREDKGTSVFSLGFREDANWEYRVVAALLRTFFIAIKEGEMEFEVGESIKVDHGNLHDFFHEDLVLQAADESHAKEEFEFARDLYDCATAEEAVEKIIKVPNHGSTGFGEASVRILKRKNLPKRLGFVRNGMMITDNLKHFDHPYRTFPMCADFVALIQPLERDGSALLKKLENPRHDQFSAERITNDKKREEAGLVMKKFGKFIREVVREETLSKPEEVETLSELAEFFADHGDEDKEGAGESTPLKFKYKLDREKHKKGPRTSTRPGIDPRPNPDPVPNPNPNPNPNPRPITPRTLREALPINDERNFELSPRKRKVFLTPQSTGTVSIEVEATGLATGDKLTITGSSIGKVERGCWIIDLAENERTVAELEFSADYEGPIEILAYREAAQDEN